MINTPPYSREWPFEWNIPEREWLVFPPMSEAWWRLWIMRERVTWEKERFAFVDTKAGRFYSNTHTELEINMLGGHNKNCSFEAYILSNTSTFEYNSVRAPSYHVISRIWEIQDIAYAELLKHYPLPEEKFVELC
jgi:hypothetical protein